MTDGFDATFFAGNRQALLDALGKGALVVLGAYSPMQRGADMAHKFEQEANFWYLTGIDAPDWRVILDGAQRRAWLVRPEANHIRDLFDGSLGDDEAAKISGIREVIDRTEAKQLLAKRKAGHSVVYTVMPDSDQERYGFVMNPAPKNLAKELQTHFNVRDAALELARLRAIKQPAELSAMQKAIDITIEGVTQALGGLASMRYEYEFEAAVTARLRAAGAEGHAYDPIVANGRRACMLHYMENNARLQKKNWLLFDVGARWRHYCADITRTIPLGTPTKWQQDVYEATLRVHDLAVSLCTPGRSVVDYHTAVETAMHDELAALRIIKEGDMQAMRRYFPHAISHGLGIDTHDRLGNPQQFEPGMVLTVEPGIYVPEKNLGVRIENDILITKNGPKNLSRALPTSLHELQRLMV